MLTLASYTQCTVKTVETVKPSVADRVLSDFRSVITEDHAKTAEQIREAIEATIAKPGKDFVRTLQAAIKRTVDQPTNGLDLVKIVTDSGDVDPVQALQEIGEALKSVR
jgi:hypothetical protein